jgi:hypothetical protein
LYLKSDHPQKIISISAYNSAFFYFTALSAYQKSGFIGEHYGGTAIFVIAYQFAATFGTVAPKVYDITFFISPFPNNIV